MTIFSSICAAYFVDGIDIGKFTMKVIDDVRTINKNVHFRPSKNCYSINELASLWEMKIGRTIPRVTISEDDLLAAAAGSIIHQFSFFMSHNHNINHITFVSNFAKFDFTK